MNLDEEDYRSCKRMYICGCTLKIDRGGLVPSPAGGHPAFFSLCTHTLTP